LAEELEPLWFTALLLRVPEEIGYYISSALGRYGLAVPLGRTELRGQERGSGEGKEMKKEKEKREGRK
jgi:hypothetical protein